jgi:hypothetical protein
MPQIMSACHAMHAKESPLKRFGRDEVQHGERTIGVLCLGGERVFRRFLPHIMEKPVFTSDLSPKPIRKT